MKFSVKVAEVVVVPKVQVEVGSIVNFTKKNGEVVKCLVVKNNLPSAKANPYQLMDLETATIVYGEMPNLFKTDRVEVLYGADAVEIIADETK